MRPSSMPSSAAALMAGVDSPDQRFAGLQAKPRKPGEGLNLLVTIRLLGEAGVVQQETDPAQELHPFEFPRLLDRFHAGIGGVVAFGERHVLGLHLLPAGGFPWLRDMTVMRSWMALTTLSSSSVSSVRAARAATPAKLDVDCTMSSPTKPSGSLPLQFGPMSNRRTGAGVLNWLPIRCHRRA